VPFFPSATKKRWYRGLDDDDDEDDHDVSHTHRPAPSCTARREELAWRGAKRCRRYREEEVEFAGFGHAEIKKRKAEKRDDGGPPRRGEEVSSRQQALPRRGWVAPRRPRINKTTARPSPVLGPAWPLPAVCLHDVGCPTSLPPPPLSAGAPIPGRDDTAAPRRAPARSSADHAHARSRAELAPRIDIRRQRSGASTGKSAKSA